MSSKYYWRNLIKTPQNQIFGCKMYLYNNVPRSLLCFDAWGWNQIKHLQLSTIISHDQRNWSISFWLHFTAVTCTCKYFFLRFSSTPKYPTTAHVYRYYWEHDSIRSLTWSNTLIPMDDIVQTWVCSSYGYKDCKHIWLTIF